MFESLDKGHDGLESIRQQIIKAIHEAPTVEQVHATISAETNLIRKLINHDITQVQYNESVIDNIPKLPGIIHCDLLSDFVDVVRTTGQMLGTPPETVNAIIAHENDHRSKAEAYGLDSGYSIQFCKVGNQIAIRPSVWFKLPADASPEEQQAISKSILSAPEYLSTSDIERLS